VQSKLNFSQFLLHINNTILIPSLIGSLIGTWQSKVLHNLRFTTKQFNNHNKFTIALSRILHTIKMKQQYQKKKGSFFDQKEKVGQQIQSCDEKMTTKGLLYDELKSQTKILNENTDTNDKLLEEQIKLEQTAYI